MEFKATKLKDVCSVNQGLQIPIKNRFKEPGKNRYFYITVQFLKKNAEKYYIENPPSNVICKKDDILVVRTGNTGQVITNVGGCFHNNFFKVTPKNNINKKFLYYVLKNEEMYTKMLNAASGTIIPDLRHSSFLDLEIKLPSFKTQKKIVKILSAIDNKIKLNNQLINTLQSIGQKLYKQWFVDFEFPNVNGTPYKSSGGKMIYSDELGYEVPENWKKKALKNMLNFERGVEPGAKNYVEYKADNTLRFTRVGDMQNLSGNIYVEKELLKDRILTFDDVIVSFDGTVGRVGYGINGGYSTGIRKLSPTENYYGIITNGYIYLLSLSDYFQETIREHASGTIILHASKSIDYLKIPYCENIIKKFSKKAEVMFKKILILSQENLFLEELKDILLPKLLNGEIDLSKVSVE